MSKSISNVPNKIKEMFDNAERYGAELIRELTDEEIKIILSLTDHSDDFEFYNLSGAFLLKPKKSGLNITATLNQASTAIKNKDYKTAIGLYTKIISQEGFPNRKIYKRLYILYQKCGNLAQYKKFFTLSACRYKTRFYSKERQEEVLIEQWKKYVKIENPEIEELVFRFYGTEVDYDFLDTDDENTFLGKIAYKALKGHHQKAFRFFVQKTSVAGAITAFDISSLPRFYRETFKYFWWVYTHITIKDDDSIEQRTAKSIIQKAGRSGDNFGLRVALLYFGPYLGLRKYSSAEIFCLAYEAARPRTSTLMADGTWRKIGREEATVAVEKDVDSEIIGLSKNFDSMKNVQMLLKRRESERGPEKGMARAKKLKN